MQPSRRDQALFDAGVRLAAAWTGRVDLIEDLGSPAHRAAMLAAVQALPDVLSGAEGHPPPPEGSPAPSQGFDDLPGWMATIATALGRDGSLSPEEIVRAVQACVATVAARTLVLHAVQDVLQQCAEINPYGDVGNARARDAARDLLAELRADLPR